MVVYGILNFEFDIKFWILFRIYQLFSMSTRLEGCSNQEMNIEGNILSLIHLIDVLLSVLT